MIAAWRIVKRRHARTAFTGEGARLYGGRWNNPGVAIVYTAESQSLAALEMVVHLDSTALLLSYVVIQVSINESFILTVAPPELPRNWRTDPPPMRVRELGDAWVRSGKSAVLKVPSATLPAEHNFLLNPHHPDFLKISIGKPSSFQFDARLARHRRPI